MGEKELLWMFKLYHSKYNKNESGCLSDFEKELGFYHQNKTVRIFLKKLIEEEILLFKSFRLVNNNSFHTYVVDKKKLFQKIRKDENWKDVYNLFNEEYALIDMHIGE